MTTRADIESALRDGSLWAAMRNGRYWRLRRNGQTQTWKTRPADYRIPVKCGLKTCTAITQQSNVAFATSPDWRAADFVISEGDPIEANPRGK